jgi:hypothetical protein
MIVLDICLSDIPKEKRRVSEKNKKTYCSIVVDTRKQPDQYGNTHTVYMGMTKEEREAKLEKVYVGNGKEFVFNQKPTPETTPTPQENYNHLPEPDDMPF